MRQVVHLGVRKTDLLINPHGLQPQIQIFSIKKLSFLLLSLPLLLSLHWSELPLAYAGVSARQSKPCGDLFRALISRAAYKSPERASSHLLPAAQHL